MSEPKRILIVDDESAIVELLADGLGALGYRVEGAHSAAEALRRVRDQIYDAAILDFSLPDMDGLMLHREIRQIDDELARRSLFISGHEQNEERLGYFSANGAGFISKPFRIEEIVDELEALWSGEGSPV